MTTETRSFVRPGGETITQVQEAISAHFPSFEAARGRLVPLQPDDGAVVEDYAPGLHMYNASTTELLMPQAEELQAGEVRGPWQLAVKVTLSELLVAEARAGQKDLFPEMGLYEAQRSAYGQLTPSRQRRVAAPEVPVIHRLIPVGRLPTPAAKKYLRSPKRPELEEFVKNRTINLRLWRGTVLSLGQLAAS